MIIYLNAMITFALKMTDNVRYTTLMFIESEWDTGFELINI